MRREDVAETEHERVVGGSVSPPGVASLDELALLDQQSRAGFGAKAANLARARAAGLSVVPGVVLTTGAAEAFSDPDHPRHVLVQRGWEAAAATLAHEAETSLVVRSSSPDEDTESESQAGRYTSVVGVAGRDAIAEATTAVIDSGGGRPMAVLVQPLVDAATSGVLFGMDPVSGRQDRLLVAAVTGLPDQLVSGRASATHYRLTRRGRSVEVDRPDDGPATELDRATLRRLARLATDVGRLFGQPQDVEWAVDRRGRLWLLQSRPITAHVPEPASPAVLGTAGVDETFPDALAPLEQDLWVPPLGRGIRNALELTRAHPHRLVGSSPVVTTVDGRVVADQLLIGKIPVHHHWFDPRPGLRRVSTAWSVGRLRGALVPLGARSLDRAERSLAGLPPAGQLGDEELLGAIERAGDALAAVHGMEVLMGMLLPSASAPAGLTGLGAAAGVLARARSPRPTATAFKDGADEADLGAPVDPMSDEGLVARHPVLLALVPPRIGERAPLPVVAGPGALVPAEPPVGLAGVLPGDPAAIGLLRESLRLRARWLQEAQAVMAGALARRLHRDGVLPAEPFVRMLRWSELRVAVRTGQVPHDLAERFRRWQDQGTPLPDRFRLGTEGEVIAVQNRPVGPARHGRWRRGARVAAGSRAEPGSRSAGVLQGQGSGGGQGTGRVVHSPGQVGTRSVLVTTTMDPRLAVVVPRLAGLVAETGSPLSHLAIVAREQRVPVVVGVPDAGRSLPIGAEVLVDGAGGRVQVLRPPDTGQEGQMDRTDARGLAAEAPGTNREARDA